MIGEMTMNFNEIAVMRDEGEQLQALYRYFDEDRRLTHSPAARIEFWTTMRYLDRYLAPGSRVLDVGAGTGAYSFALADAGHAVTAVEPAEVNLAVFRQKLGGRGDIVLHAGNALDLAMCADASADAVLLLGPLYHLHSRDDRLRAIAEARRVCRPGGMIFCAFISHDVVFLTELVYDAHYLTRGDYDHATFRLDDVPFVFHTLSEAWGLLVDAGLEVLHAVASDGPAELLAGTINALSEEDYAQYLRYHAYICEKPELLGMSNHWLFVCRN